MDQHKDAAYGAVLGAFVGDAAGAVLEFLGSVSPEKVDNAMFMPGGGALAVGPGQITDDSEMALSLAHVLARISPKETPLDDIARKYADWYSSSPFDIGNTCEVLHYAAENTSRENLAQYLMNTALQRDVNTQSKANGALMRITPMAVWGHRLSAAQLTQAVSDDARLTHPNPTCQAANAAYCLAIAHLILHPGDAPGALGAARAWLEETAAAQAPTALPAESIDDELAPIAAGVKEGAGEVLSWLEDALQPGPGPGANNWMAGFVRWAFTHTFRHLALQSGYEAGVREVLLLGGDTDTNAAIVGGMLGALHGASSIPQHMAGPVLARTAASPGIKRPQWLQPSLLPGLFEQIYQQACSIQLP